MSWCLAVGRGLDARPSHSQSWCGLATHGQGRCESLRSLRKCRTARSMSTSHPAPPSTLHRAWTSLYRAPAVCEQCAPLGIFAAFGEQVEADVWREPPSWLISFVSVPATPTIVCDVRAALAAERRKGALAESAIINYQIIEILEWIGTAQTKSSCTMRSASSAILGLSWPL